VPVSYLSSRCFVASAPVLEKSFTARHILGMSRNKFLKPGDVERVEFDRIGHGESRFVPAP
jgi:2-keto-4-pentenoate hydratase/2-oxohepta-3-ene-1,7-dioic acid hydratase in catechol pathway